MNPGKHPLVTGVTGLLAAPGAPPWPQLIELLLRHFGCTVGTVHVLDQKTGLLQLAAQTGLPPVLLDKVATIPIGKGMAGIAAERRQPVQVCNLQSDTSGVVRPGAKLTRMEGSVAVPMLDGATLTGVLGVAKPVAYDFTPAETQLLLEVGACIARRVPR
jgi:signal transduction protein with GAF and PtsI domain